LAGSLLEAVGSRRTRGSKADPRSAVIQIEDVITQLSVLLEPWASYLDDWRPTELVIAPHSLLTLFPIHAAPLRGKPLIERFPVTYLPSSSLVGALHRTQTDVKKTLLIGNPTNDLPGAEAEALSLKEKFSAAGLGVNCLINERATSGGVLDGSTEANILHFACHSGLDHRDFLLSGFELSDRRMTVLEIMANLDLKNTSLAYLSSCDSARAVIGKTEELMALARAFFYAGSPTVLASLWPLNDEAGRVFAESFYDNWLPSQLSVSRTFQSAMLRTRERFPDPFFWAPFTLLGAW
jgi:CHAT domain-containing protein